MKSVDWPLMAGLLHWYSDEGMGGAAPQPGPTRATTLYQM